MDKMDNKDEWQEVLEQTRKRKDKELEALYAEWDLQREKDIQNEAQDEIVRKRFKEIGLNFIGSIGAIQTSVPNINFGECLITENGTLFMEYVFGDSDKEVIECANGFIAKIKSYRAFSKHDERKNYYGAIKGSTFSDNVKESCYKIGLYVIELSGENTKVTPNKKLPSII